MEGKYSSNQNLFYSLYSSDKNVVTNSGYTCNSALNEHDTSFDISGSAGVITDSQGNTIASIDMSQIHSADITQYNSETRILQPYSCCLLQGQEYGLSCASYYFMIPEQIESALEYEMYTACDFDVVYDNFVPYHFHISAKADCGTSFVDQINEQFNEYNISVSVSLQELIDPNCNYKHNYLVFLSQKEGYFYYINNLKLTPAFQSEEHPTSPFSKAMSGLRTTIYDYIEKFHPTRNDSYYDPENYEVDVELYKWILYNYEDAVINLKNFSKAIQTLQKINEDMDDWQIEDIQEKADVYMKDTVYDMDIISSYYNYVTYDTTNLELIYEIINAINMLITETNEYFQDFYWLHEDLKRRIPLMKYPNGAFRGIVVIPDFPDGEDFEYSTLWVHHVKSQVKLYRPTKEHQFLPKIYGVLANATLMAECECVKHDNPMFGGFQTNGDCHKSIGDGWNDRCDMCGHKETLNTDYEDPYRPEHSIYEDSVYMGQQYYSSKKDVVGLFRYMQYVNDNKLWNKVGDAYMIIGKADDHQSKIKNLPTSLLIYNPNPVPIRIRYLIFS